MNGLPLLSILTAVPIVGALVILLAGEKARGWARGLAMVFSLAALAITLWVWHIYPSASGQVALQEFHQWIPSLGASYHLGVDGLGVLMLLLSAIVVPMAIAASSQIVDRVPLYFALVLLLQAGLFGTFTALNFFHWFLFWELSLIPAFFLIKFWGGAQRSAAATQFFVYTMVGSVALLLAFLAISLATGKFDFLELADLARHWSPASGTYREAGTWCRGGWAC